MSAEALRAFTIDQVNKEAVLYVEDLVSSTDAPLDRLRYAQGFIAGLKRAIELQQEAWRGMNM